MPTYLDFDSTKRFRDVIIAKTLPAPNGPRTFTSSDYTVKSTSDMANLDPGAVDTNRTSDLLTSQNANTYKPNEYYINENLNTYTRKANLALYPAFQTGQYHNLVGIMSTDTYETESELMKFAMWNIKENPEGPIFARVAQNLYAATVGRVNLIDALQGNTSTAINLLTGKETIIENNNKITVAKGIVGKAVDFAQTVAGIEFPWAEIPGDYLSNPKNPVNYKEPAASEIGRLWQDATGAIGSMLGIKRRTTTTSKPSDLFIDYMGSGTKQSLFTNLSYSKYAPNYTTTARSQNSSKLFNMVDQFGQSVKNMLGLEAPVGTAYIGDDRGNDVKYAMNDFNDRPVRSSYYLTFMFDEVQATLFQRKKNIGEGGGIAGKLTWISSKSKNQLGANNAEFTSERSQFGDSLSTNQTFRTDSILGVTQELLETMPTDAGTARSHVSNVIDQTSRIFREGDVIMSRGSAIKYVNQFTGQETGVEYCRVWTKDRSYMNYSDTMRRTGTSRKFESSVLSTPWNLNIYPNSNGKNSFDGSTNIAKGKGDGFYAKKYMFSLENLAWKLSNTPGFTYNDLPYCERGPNGGRIMWFPPYDLKVSEQNSANWQKNAFLGRPEPVYTYQDTERSGQVSFKVIVDHPSILNLLVKEHFKGMSDEEADNYINAFFAGCEDIDFYGLIRKYTTLTTDELDAVKTYLNQSKDPKTVKRYKTVLVPVIPDTATPENVTSNVGFSTRLYFKNDYPSKSNKELYTNETYEKLFDEYFAAKTEYKSQLYSGLTILTEGVWGKNQKSDYKVLTGVETVTKPLPAEITNLFTEQDSKIETAFSQLQSNYNDYNSNLTTLKASLSDNKVKDIKIRVGSSTSSVADQHYNLNLAYRRSYSIIKDMVTKLAKPENVNSAVEKIIWKENVKPTDVAKNEKGIVIDLKDFGYEKADGKFVVEFVSNIGEQRIDEGSKSDSNVNCTSASDFYTSDYLKRTAPVTFWCRESRVDINYETQLPDTDPAKAPLPKKELVEITDSPTGQRNPPPIDEIKKVIMKALSECYYFKKLEEESPVQFTSLKEKLRYFHPAFHSMTPEGLNARLTFLNQCVRPGDTLPIKGLSDESDLNARNTTFGPPPICVLRIGDFYHSKVVIRDVNITFEENVWDLNPEGIGVQPMIANVQLQVNFIGGHGLERPVERLQNALSSNFYANTEMYDPRSIATEDRSQFYKDTFTKEFLDDLNREETGTVTADPKDLLTSPNPIVEGDFIGTAEDSTLDYTTLIDGSSGVFTQVKNYIETFIKGYNSITATYDLKLGALIMSPDYRLIKDYTVQTGAGTDTIELLGNYQVRSELDVAADNFKLTITDKIKSENISTLMGFDKEMPGGTLSKSEELLNKNVVTWIGEAIDNLVTSKPTKDIEAKRNDLIKTLDKLNFIVETNGHDGKIEGKNYIGVNVTGYTYDIFYGAYSNVISFIKDNQSKFNEDLDTSYNFYGVTMTTDELSHFLSVLLRDKRKPILDLYTKDPIFTTKIQSGIAKRLDKFLSKPLSNKDFGIKKYPTRKDGNKISFGVVNEDYVFTNDEIEKLINTKRTKSYKTTTELNYYRAYE